MQIWIVSSSFSTDVLSDELFHRCLLLVDTESQKRVQRFYRRQDAWRCLIGRLLPRALLRLHNVPLESAIFRHTIAGKPFIEVPNMHPSIGFNITHDNDIVAMVSRFEARSTANKIGIDIMKCALPKGETVRSFMNSIEDALTQSELAILSSGMDDQTTLRYIFMLWTLKEAYTKAIGVGLGFDFKRIDYNIPYNFVTVDSGPTLGWEFLLFVVEAKGSGHVYQGAVASWVGEEHTRISFISNVEDDPRVCFKELSQLLDYIVVKT